MTAVSVRRTVPVETALRETTVLLVVSGAAGVLAWGTAQAGLKGVLAAGAGCALAAALVVVRRREDLLLVVGVLSIGAMLHKSFGPLAEVSSGPPSIYVSSFDVMVGALWFAWFLSGPARMLADLREAYLAHRALWTPVLAAVLMLPSVLVARDTSLAVAELVRMGSMYLVLVLFAVRVRTRQQVWLVLGALGAVVCVEAVVVVGQRLTTSPLGLSLFGTPTILTDRDDGIAVARPFGTMAHPVFLAAFVGALALLAYCLAVTARGWRTTAGWLVVSVAGLVPLVVSNARSACLAVVVAFLAVTAGLMATGRLRLRPVVVTLGLSALAAVPLLPSLVDMWEKSVRNEHFSLEWESRTELNQVAVTMFEDAPLFGHGLNNFEQAMGPYDRFGLIFADNPVHNLYLLQLAETGLLGLLGMAVFAVPVAVLALRLTRSRDRLHSGLGFGVVAVLVFWAVEESLVFSLRQDHPRALLFVLAGLVLACSRMEGPDLAGAVPEQRRPDEGASPWAAPGPAPERRAASSPRARRRQRSAMRPPYRDLRPRAALGGPRRAAGLRWAAVRRDLQGRPRTTPLRRLLQTTPARQRVVRVLLVVALPLAPAVLVVPAAEAEPSGAPTTGLRIVLSGIDRSTGLRGIYTVTPGLDDLVKVSPDDGRQYSWPSWALGGTKIVFTARGGRAEQGDQIYVMDADGSDVRRLTDNAWRNAQPQVTADGRHLLFTSMWEEYREVGLYRMDLATGLVENVSAATHPDGAFDSDPQLSPDPVTGRERITFIDARGPSGGRVRPGQIATMALDGTGRTQLTDDGLHNTDPAMAPDGSSVVVSRYVGEGTPQDPSSPDPFQAKLQDFVLVRRDLPSGHEVQLTGGAACYRRSTDDPCSPAEGSAYLPRWHPDGGAVAYLSVLSSRRTCICVVDADGGAPRTAFESEQIAVNEFAWTRPAGVPATAVLEPRLAAEATSERLLVTGTTTAGRTTLTVATPDLWGGRQVLSPPALTPVEASWGRSPSEVVFEAAAGYDARATRPFPGAPAGARRSPHFTLDLPGLQLPPAGGTEVGRRQVWSWDLTGLAPPVRLSRPGTEDWRDALAEGEVRGNVEPDVSPDGRYAVFSTLSSAHGERSVLRQDLRTGEVLSLTNATSGALPVADSAPAWAPDGRSVAVASHDARGTQIWVMDADGGSARAVTDDEHLNTSPAWAPDGRSLVYASYRGTDLAAAQARTGWSLVRVDLASGRQQVLTRPQDSPTLRPVFSRDGSSVFYIGLSGEPAQPDVHVVSAAGGTGRPVQVTRLTAEHSVDVR